MNWLLLSRMLGLLGMLVGASMIFSLPWAFPICGQTEAFETRGFLGVGGAMLCSVALGGLLYYLGRRETASILRKEALAIVGLGWLFAGLLGALPYLFAGTLRAPETPMTVIDAVFESVSGFTTTGASVLTELEDPRMVPRCVLFWRSFTHWLGGMGIIVLFVAVLGQLGAGGKALMRREVPGPIRESVRPRVRETALLMWLIYMVISVVLTGILMVAGLNLYDALCHSFGTMATGGFSTYNKSIGHFDSVHLEMILVGFMVIAGTNFTLYYLVLKGNPTARPGEQARWWHRFAPMYRDPEYRTYLGILLVATAALTASLMWEKHYDDFFSAVRHSAFMSVTIMTTTGFGTEDFTRWSEFSKGLILLLMYIGGSAGSTGGGIKVIRFILFIKIVRLEIEHAFRPNVVRPLRLSGNKLDDAHRHDVMVYFSLVLLLSVSSWMILAAIEPNSQWTQEGHSPAEKLLDCASAVASSLNNIGPGLGVLGPHKNYAFFSQQGKLLLTSLMLLGRLELFSILVLLFPSFWRTQ